MNFESIKKEFTETQDTTITHAMITLNGATRKASLQHSVFGTVKHSIKTNACTIAPYLGGDLSLQQKNRGHGYTLYFGTEISF